MHPAERERLLHSGLRVSILAAGWTLAASTAGLWIGTTTGSTALVAFGGVGILDAAGSITLAVHFRLTRASAHWAGHAERLALRVITAGLIVVGTTTAGVSVLNLLDHHRADESVGGVVLAGTSCAVLSALALRKRWLAHRIPSRPLMADSQLSAVGAVLAALTLTGAGATDLLGWWWADPAAAIGIAMVAAWLGAVMAVETRKGAPRTGRPVP
jgi:divalent metal cation (Fe/Co/Zn/Cd) transporter